MINLIVAYYENIGPFQNKNCSLIFDEGKYLIKAPIGSGKSFLFFDAPCYALYKDSSRNMLNLHSKNGEISMIFESEGMYYLIKRILKSTRMGNDSCSSKLYSINYTGENLLKEIKNLIGNDKILQPGTNCIKLFENEDGKKWKLDEISFKNETDLQLTLETFLPPKEVFLSTVFLLQDADNIFEMKPSERLIVLKNVFNLLGIDDAKETIQDKKREVQYKLKALQDHSMQDSKLRSILKSLWSGIKNLENDSELKSILDVNNSFFEDIEGFFDQLSINDFSLNGLDKASFDTAESNLNQRMNEIIKLDAQIDELKRQQNTLTRQIQQNNSNISSESVKIQNLVKKIEDIDVNKGNDLKEKKINLYNQSSLLDKNQNYNKLEELVERWNNEIKEDSSIPQQNSPISLKQVHEFLQILKDAGIKIKSKLDFEIVKLEKMKLELKNWQEKQAREIERIKDLKNRKEDDIKQLRNRIEELDNGWKTGSDFDCPDLCKKCPHIAAINKQQFEQYSQQKEKLLSQIKVIETEVVEADFDKQIKDIEAEKYSEGESCDLWIDLESVIKKHTNFNEELKNRLISIGFSSWEKLFQERDFLQNEIQKADRDYIQREESSKHLDVYQQEKIAAEYSLSHLQKLHDDYLAQSKLLIEKTDNFSTEKELKNKDGLQQQLNEIKHISQHYLQLKQLMDDSVSNNNLMKELQEKEKKLSRLYSIFSKDLILLALEGYLPNLCEIINSFLSQCVDYSLNMQIIENGEKLELDAKIIDSKGEREVKSLSGGQKTVLKLVRMLAISSYLRTPLLFLDETINNLDGDTVGKVSEMINNFVKQRTMKFYTVTHNKEIQDMQIWDKIIEINTLDGEK